MCARSGQLAQPADVRDHPLLTLLDALGLGDPTPRLAATASTHPLTLVYHLAVLVGDAETVRLLAAEGLPPFAADTICNGPALAGHEYFEQHGHRELLNSFFGTALCLAARVGNAELVAALLEAGVPVNTPSPKVPDVLANRVALGALVGRPDWTTSQPATPLDVVACCAAEFGEQRTEALLQRLLAAGADVTRMNLRSLSACSHASRGPTQLLLQHFQQASQEGRLTMSVEEDTWMPLLRAAVASDSVPLLEYLLGQVVQLPLPNHMRATRLPIGLLCTAAAHDSVSVLELAAAQQAAGNENIVTSTLGPRFGDCLPRLLEKAARDGRMAVAEALLDAAEAPMAAVVIAAVDSCRLGCLNAVLRRGLPVFDAPLPQPIQLPSINRQHSRRYTCPVLATLQARLGQVGLACCCVVLSLVATAACLLQRPMLIKPGPPLLAASQAAQDSTASLSYFKEHQEVSAWRECDGIHAVAELRLVHQTGV